jgi:sugar transferase EpsL
MQQPQKTKNMLHIWGSVAVSAALVALIVMLVRLSTHRSVSVLELRLGDRQYPFLAPKTRTSQQAAQRILKRTFDIVVAAVALIVLAPVMLLVTALVRVKIGSPVLFRQTRPGLYARPFTMYKFRTMTNARDANGNLLPDADRMTAFGQFLRSTSLDELPELFNVLKGEMSLVGPRPLLMQYIGRYSPAQARRHNAKPGITGWAQINGRNAISWKQKFDLDVWYTENQSLLLDIKIIFLTVWKIVKREGISQPGHVTTEEFLGEPEQLELAS